VIGAAVVVEVGTHREVGHAVEVEIAERRDRDAVRGQAYNAGGERPYSVLEIVATITRLAGTGVEPEIRGTGNPQGEIDRQFVAAGKLRELCDWQPRVNLEDGLRRTIDWYAEHPEIRPAG
jgi:CDP-glucose 4,6-dehydratase